MTNNPSYASLSYLCGNVRELGREEGKYIHSGQVGHLSKGGIYHLGHLSMYTFRLSNRVICLTAGDEKLWNMGGDQRTTPLSLTS